MAASIGSHLLEHDTRVDRLCLADCNKAWCTREKLVLVATIDRLFCAFRTPYLHDILAHYLDAIVVIGSECPRLLNIG